MLLERRVGELCVPGERHLGEIDVAGELAVDKVGVPELCLPERRRLGEPRSFETRVVIDEVRVTLELDAVERAVRLECRVAKARIRVKPRLIERGFRFEVDADERHVVVEDCPGEGTLAGDSHVPEVDGGTKRGILPRERLYSCVSEVDRLLDCRLYTLKRPNSRVSKVENAIVCGGENLLVEVDRPEVRAEQLLGLGSGCFGGVPKRLCHFVVVDASVGTFAR